MDAMIVVTAKRDGGTQDVLGFFPPHKLLQAMRLSETFLLQSERSRRAIVRIELYNPHGKTPRPGKRRPF